MKLFGLLADIRETAFVVIDLKEATIRLSDGTGTPNTLDIKVGEGNLTYSESRNVEYILDRGNLSEVRLGDQVPLDVSFDLIWDYISSPSSGTIPSPEDALKQKNRASGWTSSDSDVCRPYALDVIVIFDPACATADTETITLPDFRYESIDHDLRAGTLSVSGKCNAVEATAVRTGP